jgi:hypothetical protein
MMKHRIDLNTLLSRSSDDQERLASFALLALGVIESLAGGAIGASAAVELFFCADNCLFVRRQLRHEAADEIMSRGVQLPDVLEALPAQEAQREFQRELAAMRSVGLKLLGDMQAAA